MSHNGQNCCIGAFIYNEFLSNGESAKKTLTIKSKYLGKSKEMYNICMKNTDL